MAWLEGKKTYIVALVAAIVGLLQGGFGVEIPEWANYVLAALGVTTLRSAVAKAEK